MPDVVGLVVGLGDADVGALIESRPLLARNCAESVEGAWLVLEKRGEIIASDSF